MVLMIWPVMGLPSDRRRCVGRVWMDSSTILIVFDKERPTGIGQRARVITYRIQSSTASTGPRRSSGSVSWRTAIVVHDTKHIPQVQRRFDGHHVGQSLAKRLCSTGSLDRILISAAC